MTKQIRVNGFEMATPGHINHGLWRVPGNRRTQYKDLGYWTDLARVLERGLFDAVFLADVVGTYTTYGGSRRAALRAGMQVPNIDPTLVVSAMASVTEHLGFAVTSTTTYEPPFGHARRLSTLDHLTRGRLAWNIVTGYLPDAARNFGLSEQIRHDDRYAIAEEYLEVVYRLLEGSWEDDAVVLDAENLVYTDPDKVHEIGFDGEYFSVAGPHLAEPSPQRTPVLYQAGTSSRGKAFAARHAEAVFLLPRDDAQGREEIADLRRLAVEAGRGPDDVKAFVGAEVVVAPTRTEVEDKLAVLQEFRDLEGHLVLFSGWAGIDLAGDDVDTYLEYRGGDAMQTFERMWSEGSDRKKVGELVSHLSRPENDPRFIAGTPQEVADRLEELVDGTDADGINLIQQLSPATFADFTEHVVPELQRRGRYRTAYTPGETLRERLFGEGQTRPRAGHPSRAFAVGARELAGAASSHA